MLKKPNMESQPMIIEGHKAWHIGKDPAGKEVYQLEEGFLKLKNGKTEYGEAIDDDGNFVNLEEPETAEEPGTEEAEDPPEAKPKKGKKKDGNAV